MDPDSRAQNPTDESEQDANAMRAEAAAQLLSARNLAKRIRGEAARELEDARARVTRITEREEEMAERWAQLVAAENAMDATAAGQMPSNPPALVAEAQTEAFQIIERANEEAIRIREAAMRLLAVAEGEKAESHVIAQTETERAISEADRLRAEGAAEAQRLREEAAAAALDTDESPGFPKRRGRKLPRIGESATSVLSEMSGLRAKPTEDDRQTG